MSAIYISLFDIVQNKVRDVFYYLLVFNNVNFHVKPTSKICTLVTL
jgi:hypothetical protein